MEYTTFGKTGRKVSKIGYGGTVAGLKDYMKAFDPEEQRSKEQLIDAMREAFRLGVNYFDTAAAYGNGTSERIYGEALEPLPKEELFLATKVSITDGAGTRASLERSLKNLRRDYIDLLQIHGTNYSDAECDAILGKGGMAEVMEKAKEEGLVRHIGFTVECQNTALYRFIESGRFDTMQVEYNLLFQHPYDPSWKSGSLYNAKAGNMGTVSMRSVTSGTFQKWVQMVNPANTFDYTPALLQFVLSNPLLDVALVGMRTKEEVAANVAIVNDLAHRVDLGEVHSRYVK